MGTLPGIKLSRLSGLAGLSFFFLLALVYGCKELKPEREVKISTDEISNISCSSCLLKGTLIDLGSVNISRYGFCWAVAENPTTEDSYNDLGVPSAAGAFTAEIDGLTDNTTFYVRSYAEFDDQVVYGDALSFTTEDCDLPVVTTSDVTVDGEFSVSVEGIIASDGGSAVIERGICWSTNPSPDLNDDYSTEGGGAGSFTSDIGDLDHGTTYYFKAYATTEMGTGYGNEQQASIGMVLDWENSFGSPDVEKAMDLMQVTDGGYLLIGRARNNGGDVSGSHGGSDAWLVKADAEGDFEWQNAMGGSGNEYAYDICPAQDGGFMLVVDAGSNDGDVSDFVGVADFWIVKLLENGEIDDETCIGGTKYDLPYAIRPTSDGGYIVAGSTLSDDHDVSDNNGNSDGWIVKLTSDRQIDWEDNVGGSNNDYFYDVIQTPDGGYLAAGGTFSNDQDVEGQHGGGDCWVVKYTAGGDFEWQRTLGGTDVEWLLALQNSAEGGYIVAGGTASDDGDIAENHGASDYWIVKLNSSGDISWEETFGGSGYDFAGDIKQSADGNYIIVGASESNNGDVTGNHGGSDYWVLKIDQTGELIWEISLGGTGEDWGWAIIQSSDGRYVIAGESRSNNDDVTGNHGDYDMWLVKIKWADLSK